MKPTLANIEQLIKQIMDDPAVTHWFKESLANALDRDCVDAAHDAALLAHVLQMRADAILEQ